VSVTSTFWLPPTTAADVSDALVTFVSRAFPWSFLPLALLTSAAVLAMLVPTPRPRERELPFLILVVPLVVSLLLSLKQPIFLARNLLPASLGLYLLVTRAILSLGPVGGVVLGASPLFAMNAVSMGEGYFMEKKEDWRSAAFFIRDQAQPGDQLLFDAGYGELPFRYYEDQLGFSLPSVGYPNREGLLDPAAPPLGDLAQAMKPGQRVWVVLSHDATVDPHGVVEEWFDAHAVALTQADFTLVRVRLFGLQPDIRDG
jgi:hypothetical protein